jgi:outer membrane receptor protein involved in Fe transport
MVPAAYAQANPAPQSTDDDGFRDNEIVVTAQRSAQSAQDVPIAVSAFSAEALEEQQIENSSDLQLTLPNVTFTKTNFTSASFTIRGIGDLCVGVSCDAATAIHLNDNPLFATRLFETEFFDLERVEVLRGPQGTLFGRNATSGVVNVITAKPKLGKFEAAVDGEYGNFKSIKAKAMVNIPLGDTMGVRLAGIYVNRDGYTKNLTLNERYDDRDLFSIRGSFRWEPSEDTTVDIMGSYFREDDRRMRIQKAECQRDPTGILGCLNARRDRDPFNSNSTFTAALTSKEFLSIRGIPAGFALGSLYGPDTYSGDTIPTNTREIETQFRPEYFTDELIVQAKIEHDFGPVSLQVSGNYQDVNLDSKQDYNQNIGDRTRYLTGLSTLQAFATGAAGAFFQQYFAPVAAAIIPNGPTGVLCTSDTDPSGFGAYGGNKICNTTALQFDRSNQSNSSWSAEAILSSDLDGPFNFLVGGIYSKAHLTENSYYVNAFPIDYVSGVLGAFTAAGNRVPDTSPGALPGATVAFPLPASYLGTPFFRNNTDDLKVSSFGIFGEAYFEISDKLKFTAGLRYNDDKKDIRARSTLASFLVPHSLQTGSAFDSPFVGSFDADPGTAGNQLFQSRTFKGNAITGRAVLDYKISDDNLLYLSYSRGYKSGGINPPLQPIFDVPESFKSEQVDAFEIGLKNNFGRALQLNLTAFYYKYKDLQLSKIVARTSVNDNVSANVYGFEAEAIVRLDPAVMINLGFSYLKSEVSEDKMTSDPRDFGGGRADAVIIKDITNASNCAVIPTIAGNAATAQNYVNAVNNLLNGNTLTTPTASNPLGLVPRTALNPNGAPLQPVQSFPSDSGIASSGAFSVCGYLSALAPSLGGGNVQVKLAGVEKNLRGNELPQAPNYKFSVGAQYTAELGGGSTLVPRIDMAYTGESFGNIFNGNVNKIQGYTQVNGQLTFNGPDEKWHVKGFVQNVFNSGSVTGLYVTDQSSGLYTNIFTLEPRRYGIAAGFKF